MAFDMAGDSVKEAFEKAWQAEGEKLGRFNLAIFGKTGVGKSTLVNAIFGTDIAETGVGKPVTAHTTLHVREDGRLGVYDTRGLEVGVDTRAVLHDLEDHLRATRKKPLSEQIHVAWYCVRAGDRRFEDTEAKFVEALRATGLPVMLVLTQVSKRGDDVRPDTLEFVKAIEERDLPVFERRAFLTMARAEDFDGLPAHGLQELLDATYRAAPDAVAAALDAAQQIDMARKRKAARGAIAAAASLATAAGATPIPFADAAVLVPIQVTMMARIAVVYGIPVGRATFLTLAATAGATAAGRGAVIGLLKLIPGAGMVVGGAISAAVAAAFTTTMGEAWIRVCEGLATGKLGGIDKALDSEAVRKLFLDEFGKRATK